MIYQKACLARETTNRYKLKSAYERNFLFIRDVCVW